MKKQDSDKKWVRWVSKVQSKPDGYSHEMLKMGLRNGTFRPLTK